MYPVLFTFGSIMILSLWFFVAAGFLVSGLVMIKLSIHNKLKVTFLIEHFITILLYGLIGARLTYLVLHPQIYFFELNLNAIARLFMIWDNGLNIWGGITGIVIGLYHYAKAKEENFKKWLDMLAISALAGIPFGHIGAFLEGLNYGKETDLPWGITFYNLNIPYVIPIHPTQLYAFVYSLIIFGTLFLLNLKKKNREPGILAAVAVFLYSTMRFLETFVRGDSFPGMLGLNTAHWITLPLLVSSGLYILLRYNKTKNFTK